MKKLMLLPFLVLFSNCKKDTSNQVSGPPSGNKEYTNSYILSIINDPVNRDVTGDTLKIAINGKSLPLNFLTPSYYHTGTKDIPRIKTGDIISVFYHPGIVTFNNKALIDENRLKIYLDDRIIQDTKCRCVINFTRTIQ